MLMTRAHLTIRRLHETGAFGLRPLAQRLGIYPQSLLYILGGSLPKVNVALAIERELGIAIEDWDVAAEGSGPGSVAVPPTQAA
jgi:hypothetical protein